MNFRSAKTTLFLVGLIAALAVAALWLRPSALRLPPAELASVLLETPRPLQPFTLIDQEGAPLTLERLRGHWTLLFFGYTHCPDICPTTLAVLKGAMSRLDTDAELAASTRTLFISVDPRRDTPAQLKQYITYFNPTFMAATGSKEEIDNLTRQVGAVYMFEGDTRRDDYIVNHSATILLVDPQGRLYARFNAPHSASGIADTYRRIRAFHDH
ncbi:MAG TPA: SCO family protein [Gammaproteobacteria bacterium]